MRNSIYLTLAGLFIAMTCVFLFTNCGYLDSVETIDVSEAANIPLDVKKIPISDNETVWMGQAGNYFVEWKTGDIIIISADKKTEYRFSDAAKLIAHEAATRASDKKLTSLPRLAQKNDSVDLQNTIRVFSIIKIKSVAGPLVTFDIVTSTMGAGSVSTSHISRLVTIDLSRDNALAKTKQIVEEAMGKDDHIDDSLSSNVSLKDYFTDKKLAEGIVNLYRIPNLASVNLTEMIENYPATVEDNELAYWITPESFHGFVIKSFNKEKVTVSMQAFTSAGESYQVKYVDVGLERNLKINDLLKTGTTIPYISGMDVFADSETNITADQEIS